MKVRRIDVRDLEPPQPMVRIAREIETLKEDEVLEVIEGYLLRIWRAGRKAPKRERAVLEINENTNVGDLIDRYPEAVDVLVRYGFTPLRSRMLRRFLPYMVTLGQAKRIRGLSDEEFESLLRELRKLQTEERL